MKKIVKFEIQDLLPIGFTLIVAGIGLVYGMNIMGDIKSDFCDDSLEHYSGGICYSCPNSSWNTFATTDKTCMNTSQSASSANVSPATHGTAMEDNASVDAIRGVAKIPEKMPLIATVIIAAVVIGILVRYLMVRFA